MTHSLPISELARARRRARGRTILPLILIPALLAALSAFAQDGEPARTPEPAPAERPKAETPKADDGKADGEAAAKPEEASDPPKATDSGDGGEGGDAKDPASPVEPEATPPLRDPTRPGGVGPAQATRQARAITTGRLLLPELQLVARLAIEGRAMVALIRVEGRIQRLREGDRFMVPARRSRASSPSRAIPRGRGARGGAPRQAARTPASSVETVTIVVKTVSAERVVLVPLEASGRELTKGEAAPVILR